MGWTYLRATRAQKIQEHCRIRDGEWPHQLFGQAGQDKWVHLIAGPISHWKTRDHESRKLSVCPALKLHHEFGEKHLSHECGPCHGHCKDPYQHRDFLDIRKISKYCILSFWDWGTISGSQLIQSIRKNLGDDRFPTDDDSTDFAPSTTVTSMLGLQGSHVAILKHLPCRVDWLKSPSQQIYDNYPITDTYAFWTTCLAWYQEGETYSSTRNIGDLPQHPAAVAFLHSHRCSSRGTGWQIRTRRWQAYRHQGDFSPQPGSPLSLQVLARMTVSRWLLDNYKSLIVG